MSVTALSLFGDNGASAAVFNALVPILDSLGQHGIEEKKTSVHVATSRGRSCGVHPRKRGLRLNVVSAGPLESSRIANCERVSANRYQDELDNPGPRRSTKS